MLFHLSGEGTEVQEEGVTARGELGGEPSQIACLFRVCVCVSAHVRWRVFHRHAQQRRYAQRLGHSHSERGWTLEFSPRPTPAFLAPLSSWYESLCQKEIGIVYFIHIKGPWHLLHILGSSQACFPAQHLQRSTTEPYPILTWGMEWWETQLKMSGGGQGRRVHLVSHSRMP